MKAGSLGRWPSGCRCGLWISCFDRLNGALAAGLFCCEQERRRIYENHQAREWERACADFSDLSPFVLLKLSMVRYGARLSPGALERLQDTFYSFGKAEPFGIHFEGRTPEQSMPGPILLRDGTFVYINYGEAFADPYDIDYDRERGVFPAEGKRRRFGRGGFRSPARLLPGKRLARGTPWRALADVRAQKLILTAYQRCRFWERGTNATLRLFTSGNSGPVDCQDIYETVREAIQEPGRFFRDLSFRRQRFWGSLPLKGRWNGIFRYCKPSAAIFPAGFPAS